MSAVWNYMNGVKYPDSASTLHFVRTPFEPIIEKYSGENTSDSITFPDFTISLSDTLEYNASLPSQYKSFYKEQIDTINGGTYNNIDKWYGLLGCTYYPMIILDYSATFKFL